MASFHSLLLFPWWIVISKNQWKKGNGWNTHRCMWYVKKHICMRSVTVRAWHPPVVYDDNNKIIICPDGHLPFVAYLGSNANLANLELNDDATENFFACKRRVKWQIFCSSLFRSASSWKMMMTFSLFLEYVHSVWKSLKKVSFYCFASGAC